MCGIVAYLGDREAQPLLLEGLRRLEYRGYDSSGIAVLNGSGLEVVKRVGRIQQLESALSKAPLHGSLGISHTRWATHGKPTETNAHPHTDASGKLAVVHNGVIENYGQLKQRLSGRGYKFRTETDTEVLAFLIGSHFDALDPAMENRLDLAVMEAARENGILLGKGGLHGNILRFSPPLNIAKSDVDEFARLLDASLVKASALSAV